MQGEPTSPSVRLATDLLTYCAEHYPNCLPLTVCGYHIREAGATAIQEIAFSLANALEYIDHAYGKGSEVETILPKLSAFMAVNMNFFEEIAKFRALRRLWARLFKERYGIQDLSKLNFNLVNFTAGSSLTAQQPVNNIVRVAIECLAGVLGGCQSLFPCSMDEAYCTPTESSVKLALRTQQIIAHETGVANTIDPLGGSYYVEALTSTVEAGARKYLDEIDRIGGAIKAIETGYFQAEIEESSYRYQKGIESKERIVVGVNEFIEGEGPPIELFKPPKDSEEKQKKKLRKLRAKRNNRRLIGILEEVERIAETDENLTPVLIKAVKNYATVGEISDVFRKVFGEYRETGL